MAHDVFISYAAEDRTVANAVCATLEARRIRCWIAPRDVLPGMGWADAIVDAINESRIMVLLFSSSSNKSPQVMREVERAVMEGITILPVRIEDVVPSKSMEFYLGGPHWLDASTPPLEQHLRHLVETVGVLLAEIGRPKRPEPQALEAEPSASAPRGMARPKARPSVLDMFGDLVRRTLGGGYRMSRSKGAPRPTTETTPRERQPVTRVIVVDRLHFTVTAPHVVQPKDRFVINVWAHLARQRDLVMRQAREAAGGEIVAQPKGPFVVARGTLLSVQVSVKGMVVEELEDTVLWAGEIANATFVATVPDRSPEGRRVGVATVQAGGLRIAQIPFMVTVGRVADPEPGSHPGEPFRKAFASYASDDRDEVLGRVQGMQKVAPQLEVFLDVLSLRSGEDWAKRLWEVIPEHDVFYLFWSSHAKQSAWVNREWRCALKAKGLNFIDPVPLVPPDVVPPPRQLAKKHFNDWTLAFKRGERQA